MLVTTDGDRPATALDSPVPPADKAESDGSRSLYDALVEHHAWRLAEVVLAALRATTDAVPLALLRQHLNATKAFPRAKRKGAYKAISRLLANDTRFSVVTVDGKPHWTLADAELNTAMESEEESNEEAPLRHRLARLVAIQPLRITALETYLPPTAPSVEVVIRDLLRCGCFSIVADADGHDVIAIDKDAFHQRATSFLDTGFLRHYVFADSCTLTSTSPANGADPTLYDALLIDQAHRMDQAVRRVLAKTWVYLGIRDSIRQQLTRACFVLPDALAAATTTVLTHLLAGGDYVLREGMGSHERLELAPGRTLPPPQPVETDTLPVEPTALVQALVRRFAARALTAPLYVNVVYGELWDTPLGGLKPKKVLQSIVHGLEKSQVFFVDRRDPKRAVVAVKTKNLRRPVAKFTELGFLLQYPVVASPPANETSRRTRYRTRKSRVPASITDRLLQLPPQVLEVDAPDMAAFLEVYQALFLDGILAWVAGGCAFHISYIRSQVRPLLPVHLSLDDAVGAVIAMLWNEPRLMYLENDVGHTVFMAVGSCYDDDAEPSSSWVPDENDDDSDDTDADDDDNEIQL
ncbi:hypothetical protein ACHHYP_20368 [Achlya hypogyna]|uniref:Uncharacterized protein n=1 Tax=Achlya hypogyna TaxID=1202772 RepID=A0A1V9YPH3_ACHHY|nr:hypothetical protein ACHHYP_20368 [Achlya hypogyna]